MSTAHVWFITGVSSGLGLATALSALKSGQRVIGTVRSRGGKSAGPVSELEAAGATVVELDMDSGDKAIASVAASAVGVHGRIDVLMNNAGYAVIGAVEDVGDGEVRRQLETNFLGPAALTRAILPTMRAQGSGVVVNVSSTSGLDGMPACGIYAASKFALEGFSESLACEVAPLGINVVIVEPGAFRTNFHSAITYGTGPSAGGAKPSEAYRDGSVQMVHDHLGTLSGSQPGDPEKGADIIVRKVKETMGEKRVDAKRVLLGSDAIERMNFKIGKLTRDLKDGEADARSADFKSAQ